MLYYSTERFNTKVDIGDTLGVNRDHSMALEHVAQELNGRKFERLTTDQQEAVRLDTRERYLAYIFLRQSSPDHDTMKHELENLFTMASNANTRAQVYPRTRDDVFGQLQRYHKTKKIPTGSEGSSFAQTGRGGGGGGRGMQANNDYWKDKACHNCGKLGHPVAKCISKKDDEKSVDSKSSKGSKSSKASAKEALAKLGKMKKEWQKQKKSFATLEAQIEEGNNSDLTDSDNSKEETVGRNT